MLTTLGMFAVPVTAETTIGEIRQKVQARKRSQPPSRCFLHEKRGRDQLSRSGSQSTPSSSRTDMLAVFSCLKQKWGSGSIQ